MRILMFAGFYYPHVGGYEKNIHELSKRLALRGHSVTVVTCNTDHSRRDETRDHVRILRLPAWNLAHGTLPLPKPGGPNLPRADVVFTQTRFFPTSLMGMQYAKKLKVPQVHVERGSSHSQDKGWLSGALSGMYDHTIGRSITRSARTRVGVSNTASDLIRHISGVDAMTINNGITVPTVVKSLNIFFVGRLVYAKGVQDLITAFERCCAVFNNLRLIIIGDGAYRKDLENQAAESKQREKIMFLGAQSQENVIWLLANLCDVFVNPSYSEGLPTSVMEAASLGLPVIATDVGGTSEIVRHGETGILCQPKEPRKLAVAILDLIQNMEKARRLGLDGQKLVSEKFSWDTITDKYESLLKEVCTKK